MKKANRSRWYSVRLGGKLIDSVYYTLNLSNKLEREEYVRDSLRNHDGYAPCIQVIERKMPKLTKEQEETRVRS